MISGSTDTVNGGAVSLVAGSSTEVSPFGDGGRAMVESAAGSIGGAVSFVAGSSQSQSAVGPVVFTSGSTTGASRTAGEVLR